MGKVLDDEAISITTTWAAVKSPASPLEPEIMTQVERITNEIWPGVPVIPVMLTGATDGLYLRNAGLPTYGLSGLFGDIDDVRAHGQDERVGIRQFFDSQEFLYRVVKALSSPQSAGS